MEKVYPCFIQGLGEDDERKVKTWKIPKPCTKMNSGMQQALGEALAEQLIFFYKIHGKGDEDLLGLIAESMGVELDDVKIGFFTELGRFMTLSAMRLKHNYKGYGG